MSHINFNNMRDASFTLTFPAFADFYSVMEEFENDSFLRNFEKLTISGYGVLSEKQGESFEITFTGTVKKL